VLFVAVAAAVPAVAQTGSIQGQIIGHDGKGIERLTIAIDRIGISQHFETRSDNRGSFFHTGIPTGNYELSIEYGGKTLKLNARVSFGGTSTVNFDLRILVPYDTEQRHRVTTTALTVPRKAQEEWQKAFDAKDEPQKS
jgi:hypothetical protein